jgi:hypothetical protein
MKLRYSPDEAANTAPVQPRHSPDEGLFEAADKTADRAADEVADEAADVAARYPHPAPL